MKVSLDRNRLLRFADELLTCLCCVSVTLAGGIIGAMVVWLAWILWGISPAAVIALGTLFFVIGVIAWYKSA
jgi:hypothetical protein